MYDTAVIKHMAPTHNFKTLTENYNQLALFVTRSYNSTKQNYTHCFLVTRDRELSFRRKQT
jgi:hypothetical protein